MGDQSKDSQNCFQTEYQNVLTSSIQFWCKINMMQLEQQFISRVPSVDNRLQDICGTMTAYSWKGGLIRHCQSLSLLREEPHITHKICQESCIVSSLSMLAHLFSSRCQLKIWWHIFYTQAPPSSVQKRYRIREGHLSGKIGTIRPLPEVKFQLGQTCDNDTLFKWDQIIPIIPKRWPSCISFFVLWRWRHVTKILIKICPLSTDGAILLLVFWPVVLHHV